MIEPMTNASPWATGTYELMLDFSGADEGVDVMATVFAMPDPTDLDADEKAPILSHMGLLRGELGSPQGVFAECKNTILPIGEKGIEPEDMERLFGPKAGIRMLLLLFQAAQNDFNGVDEDGNRWREPSTDAFPIMERTHDVMAILKTRLYNM